jgi:esterase/lipase superfamily enzyme
MKLRITTGLVVLCTVIFILADHRKNDKPDNLSTSIVTVDGTISPVSAFPRVFKESLQTIKTNDRYDNFILFIHGRGKHPEKALNKKLIANLESDYSAKVIMFHWPSWQGTLAFPEDQARASADDFIRILRDIERVKKKHGDLTLSIRFALLTHSMGSLVLEQSVLNMGPQSPQGIFDTLLISASASSSQDHANWVNQLKLSRNLYITVNRYDPMLGPASIKELGRRLGMGLTNQLRDVELAAQAHYIDVSATGPLHHYFLHHSLSRAPVTRQIMDQILNGLPATLVSNEHINEISRKQVYVIREIAN